MTAETIFTNARIVMKDEVVNGSLRVADGHIAAIDGGASTVPGAIDAAGDYLMPGLVELHTDNLAMHFTPRPGVRWPPLPAVLNHDLQIAGAGITTVFDAVSLGDVHQDSDRIANLAAMIDTVLAARELDILRADHRLHLRCEISHEACVEYYRDLSANPLVALVSVMDHTPGQRQFVSWERFREFYRKQHGLDEEQFLNVQRSRLAAQATYAGPNRRAVVALARERGHRLASHDDATDEHIAEAVADGVAIAEFPTTVAAARAAHEAGLKVLMGAPNVVLGGSHSGNVSALDLARAGLLDILSSDYVPGALIAAAFRLAAEAAMSLPHAVATISRNPARAVGLDDRGAIMPGLRADLVQVQVLDALPIVRSVWRSGTRVI
jgi:alpha-D-ribose 1-methylphosphonate 5-triphosphate diphosphatase